MRHSEETLVALLSGKTPEAMYDALHARRCLSERALRYPGECLEFIKGLLRSSRQRAIMPPRQIERLVRALVGSVFLNETGRNFSEEEMQGSEVVE
jgi:hypothetical protein